MAKDIQVRKDNRPSTGSSMVPDFDRMIDRFFRDPFGSLLADWPMPARRYSMNVNETENAYILSAEIPGIPKDDIEINVSGNMLTLKAEHREESGREDKGQGYRRQYQSFQQSFSLPSTVDAEKIEAQCENGILEIYLPKTEMAQPKRIEVQSGKGGFSERMQGKDRRQSESSQEPPRH